MSRPFVLFALMSVIWGIPYLFIRIAVAEVSPAFLVMARTGIAAAILLPIALLRTDLRPVLHRWRWLVAFAAIEIAIPWVLLASAEQKVTSSLAALVIAGVPLVGVAIALLSGRSERMGPIGLLGLLVGIVGVAVIVGGDLGSTDPIAIVELAAVAVCYALGPVILARRLSGVPAVGVMSLSLGLTCLVYVPFAALTWPTGVPPLRSSDRSRRSRSSVPRSRSWCSPRSSMRSVRSGRRSSRTSTQPSRPYSAWSY